MLYEVITFAKQTGNELLSSSQAEKEYTFFLKRK